MKKVVNCLSFILVVFLLFSCSDNGGKIQDGGVCTANEACQSGICSAGICASASSPPPATCTIDSDCGAGKICLSGVCNAAPDPCRPPADCTSPPSTPPAAPSVLYKNPAADASNIATNADISVVFDKTMDAATFTASTFTITPSIEGSVTLSDKIATFTHGTPFAGDTIYTVTLGTNIRNASGVSLASAVTWSFRTVAAATTPPVMPTDFRASVPESHGMRLQLDWSACADCTSYEVKRIESSGTSVVTACSSTTAAASYSCMDTGLIKGTSYAYELKACSTPATNCATKVVSAPAPIPVKGDVNGDGIADFIVGAPMAGTSIRGNKPGNAYLYIGRLSGLFEKNLTIRGIIPTSDSGEQWFNTGKQAAFIGDINNDGYEDFAIIGEGGAPDTISTNRIGIFFGTSTFRNSSSLITDADIKIKSDTESFVSISSAMDINGDNIDDVIIGTNTNTEKYAYVIPGRITWPTDYNYEADSAKLSYTDTSISDFVIIFVSSAGGDFNGDGRAEVVVGIPQLNKVRILTMNPDVRGELILMPGGEFTGPDSSNFGQTVAGYGWMEGTRTIFVGAPMTANGAFTNAGSIYKCSYSGSALECLSSWRGAEGNYKFGTSLCAGVNGGGLMAGSPFYSSNKGRVKTKDASYDGQTAEDYFGVSCAVIRTTAPYASHIVGAPGYQSNKGAVYIINSDASSDDSNTWTKIEGENGGDNFGYSVGARYFNE